MSEPIRLSDLIATADKTSLEEFVQKWPDPLLLFSDKAVITTPIASVNTQAIDTSASRLETRMGLATQPNMVVTFLRKRSNDSSSNRISIGRAETCDVPLNLSNISKVHAYLTWAPDGSMHFITDAGSTNGTFVNGERLKPKGTMSLSDRTLLSFAQHHFRFHVPSKLYRLLKAMGSR